MMNSLILSSGVPVEGSDTKSSTDLSYGGRQNKRANQSVLGVQIRKQLINKNHRF